MFESIKLKLTTITPLHIGSGQLFESYRFIVDNRQMKYFGDATIAALIDNNPDKIDVFSDNILSSIKNLIRNNKNKITPDFILDSGNVVEDKINRNIWDTLTDRPYIPGSSLKGAIRTTLDTRNLAKTSPTENPFKWLKISDCFSLQEKINQVGYCLGFKESKSIYEKSKSQIEKWSYDPPESRRINALDFVKDGIEFDVSIAINKLFSQSVSGINSFHSLAKKVNDYYLPKYKEMVNRLGSATLNNSKLINDKYIQRYNEILQIVEKSPDKYLILHLGWHSEQLHHLFSELSNQQISRPNKKHAHYAKDRSVVQWLISSNYTVKNNKPDDLQPIGWVVLSLDSMVIKSKDLSIVQQQNNVDGQIAPELLKKFTDDGSFIKLTKLTQSAAINGLELKPDAKNNYLFGQLGTLFAELMTRKLITDSWRKKIITFTSTEALAYVKGLLS